MKKLLATMIALIMAVGLLSSCIPSKPSEPAAAGGAKAVKEFIAYGLQDALWNRSNNMDDPIGKALTEATGVKLIGENPVGAWQEMLPLMIASGDMPEIMSNTGNSLQLMVEAGVVRPLKNLMENSPNIVKLYGDEMGRLSFSAADREYYAMGIVRRDSDFTPDSHWEFGYYVQFPVLEAAGWPLLKTPYEFEDIIASYLKDNPTVDGRPMYGMSFWIGDNWRHSFLLGITHTSGLPGDAVWYIDPDTYEVTSIFRHPGAKRYIEWLNHLNDVGLLDPETVTHSRDMMIEKQSNGQYAGLMHAKWITWEAAEHMPVSNPTRDTLGFPLQWEPDKMSSRDQQGRGLSEGIGFSITTSASDEDARLIMDFFDYTVSDEGQMLMNFGIEGLHYTFDKNAPVGEFGEWVSNADLYQGNDPRGPRWLASEVWDLLYNPTAERVDIRNKTGLHKFGHNLLGTFNTTSSGYIMNDYKQDPDEYFSGRTPELQAALSAYGVKSEKELFPKGMPRTLGLPNLKWGPSHTLAVGSTSEAHQVANTQYLECIPVELSKLTVAPAASFDAAWDGFIKFLEDSIKIKMLEDEMTQLLDDRMTMWYGN